MIFRDESSDLPRLRYRFYFFSREEARLHVQSSKGEAKFWLETKVALAQNCGLTSRQVNVVRRLIGEHADEICTAWKVHFGS